VIAVIAISALASAVVSASQIYFSWVKRKSELLEALDATVARNKKSIERSVWYLDQKQAVATLDALTSESAILRAEIIAQGKSGIFAVSGSLTAKYDFDRVWDLRADDTESAELGSLRIFGSFAALERSMWVQAAFVIGSNMIKGALISFVLLWVFDKMVTRHLLSVVSHLYRFDPANIVPIKRRIVKKRDEIDYLMDAINDMQAAIEKALSQEREALSQKEAYMERVNEMSKKISVAEIATVVLHDINNILGGLVSLTLKAKKKRDAGDQASALTDMIVGVERINSLIAGMIHAQQNLATGQDSVWDQVTVEMLMNEVLMVENYNLEKNHIKLDVIGDMNAAIVTHKHIMVTVLVNLIKNARESIIQHNGPKRSIAVNVSSEAHGVSIAVTDSGVGATKEVLARIFERGFTTKANGHGFGLAGCRYNMTQMGGQLTISSEGFGHGATVLINHPWDASKKTNQAAT
jgi:signal transduction histidine kinase